MSLKEIGTIAIPNAAGSEFDHAAFDARSRRVFIAHTARDCIEVIDHDAGRHLATLPGFPGAAGAVADDGQILVTNRGNASVALVDAGTLETRATFKTGGRPNGAVIVARLSLGLAACIADSSPQINKMYRMGPPGWTSFTVSHPRRTRTPEIDRSPQVRMERGTRRRRHRCSPSLARAGAPPSGRR